jgi:hypothetical protein
MNELTITIMDTVNLLAHYKAVNCRLIIYPINLIIIRVKITSKWVSMMYVEIVII